MRRSSLRWFVVLIFVAGIVAIEQRARADQVVLSDGVSGDGHMTVRTDEFGAFGSFSVGDPGYGRFDPDGAVGRSDWQFWSGLMLTDGIEFQWLMDDDDWPNDFGEGLLDIDVTSDSSNNSTRTSRFVVPKMGDLEVDLVQETPASGYNFLQNYTFKNTGNAPLSLKLIWMDDQDIEFADSASDNLVGFVDGDEPRVYFIEDSDVAGVGDPGVDDRDRRISVIAQMDGDIAFDGFLVGRAPLGMGGATHLHFHLQRTFEIEEEYINSVQEITRGSGTPAGSLDDDGDNLLDDPGDVSGAMQFSLDLPAGGAATLALDFVGGSLSNAALASAPRLHPGDADQDFDFDQLDLVRVQVAAKYLSGQAATWGQGDWDGAPGGEQGDPPPGDGRFDQLDIIAALSGGFYLTGPYAAIAAGGQLADGQTSVTYYAETGELAVDAPSGVELTSINIDSAAGIFTGDAAENLGGSFDNDADANIFKATFGSSFASLSFGNVAQPGLSEALVAGDLTVVGSLQGGGGLGDVDLVYVSVPEPATWVLLGLGIAGLFAIGRRRCRRVISTLV